MPIDTTQLFAVFGTEAFLALLACAVVVVDLLWGKGRLTGPAEMPRLTAGLGLVAILLHSLGQSPESCAFGNLDGFALFFKRFFLVTALFTLMLSGPYENRLRAGRGEFPALLVFTTLGLCLLATVNDFVTLFVALELVTVTLFLLAAYRPQLPRSIEAGIKFVVVGAVAAAFLVYGIAFVYGATGSFDFAAVTAAANTPGGMSGALTFGLLLVLVGLCFKLGAVPFHVWIPDVYQGAPTPVTAFLSVGSKTAGVVLMMRLVFTVLGPAVAEWTGLLAGLAGITLLMGNLGAIPQTDMKRFLGYSGIAHAGFLMMALSVHTQDSAVSMLFYVVAYLFANIAAFLVLVVVSRTEDNADMTRIDGLRDRSPFLALVLTVSMLSLAGVPPTAGFFAKFMVLRSAVEVALVDPRIMALVVLSAVMIVVSLYYYLCIVKRIFMREATDTGVLEVSGWTRGLLLLCLVAMVVLGCYQQPLVEWATTGARALF
ncbi:MAG: NADH-quinone oxidoreductase subunit N [Planctomycetota bacterium]|nr:NADH-quinone oxidoreductase subunit N [Planctomycetota bacterium]